MENKSLERMSEQDLTDAIRTNCCQTGELLFVPKSVYEKAEVKDGSVANMEFLGFYISPGFSFYRTKNDFNMFCED